MLTPPCLRLKHAHSFCLSVTWHTRLPTYASKEYWILILWTSNFDFAITIIFLACSLANFIINKLLEYRCKVEDDAFGENFFENLLTYDSCSEFLNERFLKGKTRETKAKLWRGKLRFFVEVWPANRQWASVTFETEIARAKKKKCSVFQRTFYKLKFQFISEVYYRVLLLDVSLRA